MSRIPKLSEAMGVVLLSASFILALALLSHTPGDTSFFSHGSHIPAENLVGRAGATISEACLQLFGLGAYGLVLGGAWAGTLRLLGKPGPGGLAVAIAAAGLLVGLLPLLHLTLGESLSANTLSAGGLFGQLVAGTLVSYLNWLGAFLFSLTALIVASIVSTQVSFPSLLKVGAETAGRVVRKLDFCFP